MSYWSEYQRPHIYDGRLIPSQEDQDEAYFNGLIRREAAERQAGTLKCRTCRTALVEPGEHTTRCQACRERDEQASKGLEPLW